MNLSRDKLVITTGDISDVDGFFALAQYAKTGVDVLFIMNYPTHLRISPYTPLRKDEFGLGYTYSTNRLLRVTQERYSKDENLTKRYAKYIKLLEQFDINTESPNSVAQQFKRAYTLLAHKMCHDVWKGCQPPPNGKGVLYFCIGGINDIDPFYVNKVNNELFLYCDVFGDHIDNTIIDTQEGDLIAPDRTKLDETIESLLTSYRKVYIDFNGSMAFLRPRWCLLIDSICKLNKVRGAFIQGGVYTSAACKTIPARKELLNRMSCATMNQLYSPAKSNLFFQLMKKNKIQMYVVPNNDVEEVSDYIAFLNANGLLSNALQAFATTFYNSRSGVRVKPFDFYVALAVCDAMESEAALRDKAWCFKLFFNPKYAATLLSDNTHDDLDAVIELIKNQDLLFKPSDNEQMATDKQTFQKEFEALLSIHFTEYYVHVPSFQLDKTTMRLTIEPVHKPGVPKRV